MLIEKACTLCKEKKSRAHLIPAIKELRLGKITSETEKKNILEKIFRCEECQKQYNLWDFAIDRPWAFSDRYFKLVDDLNKYYIKAKKIKADMVEADPDKPKKHINLDFEKYLLEYWIPLCLMRYWIRNNINPLHPKEAQLKAEILQVKRASLYKREKLVDIQAGRINIGYHIFSDREIKNYISDNINFDERYMLNVSDADKEDYFFDLEDYSEDVSEDVSEDFINSDFPETVPTNENDDFLLKIELAEIVDKNERLQTLESVAINFSALIENFKQNISHKLNSANFRKSKRLQTFKVIFENIGDEIHDYLKLAITKGYLSCKGSIDGCNDCQSRGTTEICKIKLDLLLNKFKGDEKSRSILKSYNANELAKALNCSHGNISQKFSELIKEFKGFLFNKLTNKTFM